MFKPILVNPNFSYSPVTHFFTLVLVFSALKFVFFSNCIFCTNPWACPDVCNDSLVAVYLFISLDWLSPGVLSSSVLESIPQWDPLLLSQLVSGLRKIREGICHALLITHY